MTVNLPGMGPILRDAFSDQAVVKQQCTCPHCHREWVVPDNVFKSGDDATCVYEPARYPAWKQHLACGKTFTISADNCKCFNVYNYRVDLPS